MAAQSHKVTKLEKKLNKAKTLIEGLRHIQSDVQALKQQTNEGEQAHLTDMNKLSREKSLLEQ